MLAKERFLLNLKDLMDEQELSFEKLSARIGINPRTMRRWYDNCDPRLSSLIKLSEFFDCSLEYLCGFTADYTRHPNACPVGFLSRYNSLKKEKQLTDYSICKMCRIAESTVSEWHDDVEPALTILLRLREIFACTLDYLAGVSDF